MVVEIDGGQGEGGGQIARTAVAFSCALGEDIEIRDIRKGRSPQGLRPQHLASMSLAGEMCDADIEGLKIGSTHVKFAPRSNAGGRFSMNIGTAGSVSLVLQTCLLPALFARGSTELRICGGTDVPWSPPMDYMIHVLMPLLQKMGADVNISVEQRGFYPAGGGEVRASISPVGCLEAPALHERGKLREIIGGISCRNLPGHISERMKNSVIKNLSDFSIPRVSEDRSTGPSAGVSLVLAAVYENTVLGSSCLGEKGLPAERVGEVAVERLKRVMNSDATVDEYATDQLIPFLFMAKGESRFKAPFLSSHARTNIAVAKQFLRRETTYREDGEATTVEIA